MTGSPDIQVLLMNPVATAMLLHAEAWINQTNMLFIIVMRLKAPQLENWWQLLASVGR